MSVDMGLLYQRKADAQAAADAAALAGAYWLQHYPSDVSGAATNATLYAYKNGFDTANAGVTVVSTSPWQGTSNWFHVVITTPQSLIFGAALGRGRSNVAASATAQYIISVDIPIDPAILRVEHWSR